MSEYYINLRSFEHKLPRAVPHYPALCKAFNLPVLTGRAKINQLTALSQCVRWERKGTGYQNIQVDPYACIYTPSTTVHWVTPCLYTLLQKLQKKKAENPTLPLYEDCGHFPRGMGLPSKETLQSLFPYEFAFLVQPFLQSLYREVSKAVRDSVTRTGGLEITWTVVGEGKEATPLSLKVYNQAGIRAMKLCGCSQMIDVYKRGKLALYHTVHRKVLFEQLGWERFYEAWKIDATEGTGELWERVSQRVILYGEPVDEWVTQNVKARLAVWAKGQFVKLEQQGIRKEELFQLVQGEVKRKGDGSIFRLPYATL